MMAWEKVVSFFFNALLREKWFENPEVLPGIDPENPLIQDRDDNQYNTEELKNYLFNKGVK